VTVEEQSGSGRGAPASRDTLVDASEVLQAIQPRALIEQFGRPFKAGEVLFREGDAPDEAFLLQQGRVRLLKRVRMTERSMSVLRMGDLFGEAALIDSSPRSNTAVAMSDGLAIALSRVVLRKILEQYPLLAEQILMQLVRRVGEAEDQIEVLMLRDSQSKVVGALLKMAGATDVAELQVSPVDLSARVGLDVDTVKTVVHRLREQQYVRIVGERVEVPDVDALRRLYALLGTKEELRGGR
jgi:CRP/FNR family transcriptional regulator, cyclic AMP receptor protein